MLIQDKKKKYYQQRRHLFIEEKLRRVRIKYRQLDRERNQKCNEDVDFRTPIKIRSNSFLEVLNQRNTVKGQVIKPEVTYSFYENEIKRIIVNQLQNYQSNLLQVYEKIKQRERSFSKLKDPANLFCFDYFLFTIAHFLIPEIEFGKCDQSGEVDDRIHSICIQTRYFFFLIFIQAFREHLKNCHFSLLSQVSYHTCKSLQFNQEGLSQMAIDLLLFIFKTFPRLLSFQKSKSKPTQISFSQLIQTRNIVLGTLESLIRNLGIDKMQVYGRSQFYERSDFNSLELQEKSAQFQLALVILKNTSQQTLELALNNGLFQSVLLTESQELISLCQKILNQNL